jgi:hypothetical protein
VAKGSPAPLLLPRQAQGKRFFLSKKPRLSPPHRPVPSPQNNRPFRRPPVPRPHRPTRSLHPGLSSFLPPELPSPRLQAQLAKTNQPSPPARGLSRGQLPPTRLQPAKQQRPLLLLKVPDPRRPKAQLHRPGQRPRPNAPPAPPQWCAPPRMTALRQPLATGLKPRPRPVHLRPRPLGQRLLQ